MTLSPSSKFRRQPRSRGMTHHARISEIAASRPQRRPPSVMSESAVDLDRSHQKERRGAHQDVAEPRPARLPGPLGPLLSQGNRDPDDEQEEGEDDVGQRHAVGIRGLDMEHPRGSARPQVVDEDHQQDREPAERVNRADARALWRDEWPGGLIPRTSDI